MDEQVVGPRLGVAVFVVLPILQARYWHVMMAICQFNWLPVALRPRQGEALRTDCRLTGPSIHLSIHFICAKM